MAGTNAIHEKQFFFYKKKEEDRFSISRRIDDRWIIEIYLTNLANWHVYLKLIFKKKTDRFSISKD